MHYSMEETKTEAFSPHPSTSWKEVKFMGISVKSSLYQRGTAYQFPQKQQTDKQTKNPKK